MTKIMTTDLLRQIESAHDVSGGAVFDPKLWLPRMTTLEKRGLIEIHLLGNGKHCARITEAGRKATA